MAHDQNRAAEQLYVYTTDVVHARDGIFHRTFWNDSGSGTHPFQQIEGTQMVLIMGVGMSAGVLGAQNMGAGHPERAAKSGWVAAIFGAAIMFVFIVVGLLWAEPVSRIFTRDPDLIGMSAAFLRIASASYIVLGVSAVFRHFLSGVGETMAVFLKEIFATWGFLIPLVLLSINFTDFGIWGIRWAIVIRLWLGCILFTSYFWWGRWKNVKSCRQDSLRDCVGIIGCIK